MVAEPRGNPGWPEFAFCTMSTDRKRSVLMHSSSNAGGARVVASAVEAIMVASCPFLSCGNIIRPQNGRPARTSSLIPGLRFQRFSLACRVLALACQFRDAFCIGAGFTAVFLAVCGDTVASRMRTFRCCSHKNSLLSNGPSLAKALHEEAYFSPAF